MMFNGINEAVYDMYPTKPATIGIIIVGYSHRTSPPWVVKCTQNLMYVHIRDHVLAYGVCYGA